MTFSYDLEIRSLKIINFQTVFDPRGNLTVVDGGLPFSIQRIYYIYGVPSNQERGSHAHKELEQILIPVHGSLEVQLDNGKSIEKIVLDDPTRGLYVPSLVWRTLYNFSKGAVLLVLVSSAYDKEDYVRNYAEFLELVNA